MPVIIMRGATIVTPPISKPRDPEDPPRLLPQVERPVLNPGQSMVAKDVFDIGGLVSGTLLLCIVGIAVIAALARRPA